MNIPPINSTQFFDADFNSNEGIAIQCGVYAGLLLTLCCCCYCIRRYCIRREENTNLLSDRVVEKKEQYGSTEEVVKKILHQRYNSEIGPQPDTLSRREESILSQLAEEPLPEDPEYTIHDGSEGDLVDLIDVSISEADEKETISELPEKQAEGKVSTPPLPPRPTPRRFAKIQGKS